MANNDDIDQMPHSAPSDLCLYCFLRPIRPNIQGEYDISVFQGRHLVKDDMTACPSCDFPALFSEFIR